MEESCKICQYYSPELIRLYEKFEQDVEFVGLFPNPGSDKKSIAKYKSDYRIPFTLEKDLGQLLTKKLGARITPEVFILDKKNDSIIYQGRIDNSYVRVGKRRTVVTSHDLHNALKHRNNPDQIDMDNSSPVGCFIMKEKR
jgi:thiol-disulfide isomerase/thioredoxin